MDLTTLPATLPPSAATTKTGSNWLPSGHHPFISIVKRPQVADGACGYGGSNKAVSAECDSVWKEQLLEPLPLFQ
jgi:hypothetical protein